MQLLQAVSAVKVEVKENKFILYSLQGMDEGGICTADKGIVVEGKKLRAGAEFVATERSGRMCRTAQDRLIVNVGHANIPNPGELREEQRSPIRDGFFCFSRCR